MKNHNLRKQLEIFLETLKTWQSTDIVKAGTNFKYIEKQNEAFARGWRMAVKNIIDEIEHLLS